MHQIELKGLRNENYKMIKQSLERYIQANKFGVYISEVLHEEISSDLGVADSPQIKYRGHILTFHTSEDIRIKLPKIFRLMGQEITGKKSKGGCINCDNCRCGKDLGKKGGHHHH